MILVDYSQVGIAKMASYFYSKEYQEEGFDKVYAKHVILDMIRSINAKFGKDYGELVICCDNNKYWRKQVFPYYKAGRKDNKESNKKIDWKLLDKTMNEVKRDLIENFPYKVVEVDYAEADDVIAILAKHNNDSIVISADHDFSQLQKYSGIKQYNPTKNAYVTLDVSPDEYLLKHILQGDRGDGIPNFKSPINTFVTEGVKQTPFGDVGFDKVKHLSVDEICETDAQKKRYAQNKRLIDFDMIPVKLEEAILDAVDYTKNTSLNKTMTYLAKNKLQLLSENIEDFKVHKTRLF